MSAAPLRLLDLFCGAGGAAMGYRRAGFDVLGVDKEPQPNYPFRFIQLDVLALEMTPADIRSCFDVIHASPPCQFATAYKRRPLHVADSPNLILPTRELLVRAGLPYVIENIEDAREHLHDPLRLCGSSFGLDVRRHRLFESNIPLVAPPCNHGWQTPRFAQATNRANLRRTVEVGVWRIPLERQHEAMGVDWMTREELSEAIPPAYTEFVGRQLAGYVRARKEARAA